MDPPKLTKSTFCGPLSFRSPTGDDIDKEFPGPDLIKAFSESEEIEGYLIYTAYETYCLKKK